MAFTVSHRGASTHNSQQQILSPEASNRSLRRTKFTPRAMLSAIILTFTPRRVIVLQWRLWSFLHFTGGGPATYS